MKFIVCYDDPDSSRRVMEEARRHAEKWNAELEVIHVIVRDKPIKHSKVIELEESFESKIQALFENYDLPLHAELVVDDIEPGERIVQIAERTKAKMIFLTPKKPSRVNKLLFGSNAQYIILNAPCPVVSVPHRD
ncbi:MAG: universal stress protein [Desulfotignum sp.]|nr:universal stress protein [Desulfotignum sp.]MCF8086735.1 universal stress protein [Desulfotignum sp.]MCF8136499.1 universal stress protein [Desulfotignum sp.]